MNALIDLVKVLRERSAEVLLLGLGLDRHLSTGRVWSDVAMKGGMSGFIAAEGEGEETRRLEMLQIIVRHALEKPLAVGKPRRFSFERNRFVARVGRNGEDIVVVEVKDEQ